MSVWEGGWTPPTRILRGAVLVLGVAVLALGGAEERGEAATVRHEEGLAATEGDGAAEPTHPTAAESPTTTVAEEGPSYGWLVVLLGLASAGAFTAAIATYNARRRECDALRDQALRDVDWLIAVSSEHPTPGEVGSRPTGIKSRTDRLHHTLGKLTIGADRETTTAAVQLRDSTLLVADLTVERHNAPVGAVGAVDTRLHEGRQRVRTACLRLSEAIR
jgi:hypothetical protein